MKDWFSMLLAGAQNVVQKINSYRGQSNAINKVFIQKVFSSLRVFTPIDNEWAKYYTLTEEASPTDDMWNFGTNTGLMKYYKIAKPDNQTGVFVGGQAGYTSELNATATITFNGTGLDFFSLQNIGGGKWEYILDGGSPVEFSVWRETEAYVKQNLFNNISYGEHTVVLTYKGKLPETVSGATHGRGWFGGGGNGTDQGTFGDAFWIIGSDTPNSCYDVQIGTDYILSFTDHYYTQGTHNEFAFSVKGVGSSAPSQNWIPNHSTIERAAIFDNLATDRTLKFDGAGTNYLTYTWPNTNVNFAVSEGDTLLLEQIFKGVNKDDESILLWDVIDRQTISIDGIDYDEDWTSLFEHTGSTGFCTMFGIGTTPLMFTHLLTNGIELDMISTVTDQIVASNENLPNWNGEAVYIAKTGTDTVKSVAWGFKQMEIYNAMQLGADYGQRISWSCTPGSLHKLYPTLFLGNNLPSGVRFKWNTKMTFGFVPDAYNELKSFAGL